MRIVLIFLMLLSFSANASTYTYTQEGYNGPTPQAVCEIWWSTYSISGFYTKGPVTAELHDTTPRWRCWGDRIGINQSIQNDRVHPGNSTFVRRTGTTCPPDTEINPQTYICEGPPPDPCSDKNGQSQPFTKNGTSGDGYGLIVSGFVAPEQTACFQGCAVSTTDQKCTGRTDGRYSCVGRAYFTGQQCSTTGNSTEVDENANNTPDPQPQVINEQKPCVYSDQGGKQVCQSETKTEKEGQFCGEVNGQKVCVDTKPTKNGITIDTEVETVQNADGTSTTTKTDTATKITCTGADQCTSTTIVTTTVTNTDANGNVTGVTGSCTGEACPDKNGNPDGNGDGFGDCTGDDCSNGSAPTVETPELEEVQSFQETTQAFIDRIQDAPLINAVGSIGLNGSGSCSMSSTQTAIGTISAASFCDNSHWLDPLYFIFLAIHALAAVRVLLSA